MVVGNPYNIFYVSFGSTPFCRNLALRYNIDSILASEECWNKVSGCGNLLANKWFIKMKLIIKRSFPLICWSLFSIKSFTSPWVLYFIKVFWLLLQQLVTGKLVMFMIVARWLGNCDIDVFIHFEWKVDKEAKISLWWIHFFKKELWLCFSALD